MEVKQCKACRFWSVEDVFNGLAYGACHRYPATPVLIEGDIEDRRPFMAQDDWCGEFWLRDDMPIRGE